MESTLNYSITPLQANRAYIGSWEKALYATAQITIISDTTTELVCYQTLNKVQIQTETIQIPANEFFTTNIYLNLPYVYFSLRNNTPTNQGLLNFSVIYKNQYLPNINVAKGSSKIWDTSSTGADGNSDLVYLNMNSNNVSFYGNTGGNSVLTVQQSYDGVNWFDTQYIYNTTNGNFGFNLPQFAIKYIRLKSSNDISALVYINYC